MGYRCNNNVQIGLNTMFGKRDISTLGREFGGWGESCLLSRLQKGNEAPPFPMLLWLSWEAPAVLCIGKVLFSQLSNWQGARSHTRLFSCCGGSGRVQQRHLIGLRL